MPPFKHKVPHGFVPFLLPFSHSSSKSFAKVWPIPTFSVTLPPNGGLPSLHCGALASWLIGKKQKRYALSCKAKT